MKILIVSQYFWPENFSINKIASYLASQGHEVDVLTGIPNYPQGVFYEGYGLNKKRNETYEGVNIKRVWIKPRGKKGGDKRLILNYLSYVLTASCSILGIKDRKYDATFVYAMSPITQAFPALLLRKLKKVPMCLYVGDLWPDTLFSHGISGGTVKKLITSFCSKIYQKSDRIIVVNKSFDDPVSKYSCGKRKIDYIPQSVEPLYKPLASENILRNSLGISPDDFVVMFAGNLGYAQSVKTVVEAAKYLSDQRDIQFIFVGDGSQKSECEQFCEDNGLSNCHFVGRKPQEEMPMLIAEANAMLLTLKNQSNYNLTLPGRTQAFMACCKPIICCAEGESARVIRESKAGLVCEAENAQALSAIIQEMYLMPRNELELLGDNALNYSREHYDMEKMLVSIEKVLEETVYEK